MRVDDLGVIKSIELPDSFTRGAVVLGGIGRNWRRIFHPRDKRDAQAVSIISYFRGGPAPPADGKMLRKLLAKPCGLIYSSEPESTNAHPQAPTLINALVDALGNAGNNQLTNPETGFGGPCFFLEKVETIELNKKNVLAVHGYFHDRELNAENFYTGVFVDASPNDAECLIEELVFEANTPRLYEKYYSSFQKALNTIRWN